MTKTYVVVITKTAEVEVDYEEALAYMAARMPACELDGLSEETVIELYAWQAEADSHIEPDYETGVCAVTTLPKSLRDLGYTAEELDDDNPYTQYQTLGSD